MSMVHDHTVRRRWLWVLSVLVNLVLGVVAVVPLWLVWYFAVSFPLADLGWTSGGSEDDGLQPWLMVVVPIWAAFALLWWLSNTGIRQWTGLPRLQYWITGIALTLLPTVVLMFAPAFF